MLKSMRRRFVAVAMSAFTTVILVLLLSINIWNYYMTCSQLDGTISVIQGLSSGDIMVPEENPVTPPGNFSTEVQYMIRFFTVSYDEEGNLTDLGQDYIASVSENDAEEYGAAVRRRHSDSGFYNRYRYRILTSDSETMIVFLNAERELQMVRTLLIITSVIALLCLLAVFLLIYVFSGKAIEPFARNVAAQKEFITNASHELKTPLTSIATSADVLEMVYPEDEWVANIREQTVHLSAMVSQLVVLSRLDEDRPVHDQAELSLSDLAWEISEPFTARACAVGKQLVLSIDEEVLVFAEASSMQQLLSVLLDNALKYSDESAEINMHVYRSGRKAVLEVSNPYRNSDKLNVNRLFERFYRADSSSGNKINGNGIGLSIAKAAAEANGGTISARVHGGTISFKAVFPVSTGMMKK